MTYAVSYTHLDVYKRQICYFIDEFIQSVRYSVKILYRHISTHDLSLIHILLTDENLNQLAQIIEAGEKCNTRWYRFYMNVVEFRGDTETCLLYTSRCV